MPKAIEAHFADIKDALAAARLAPLSARKTLLAVVLLDNFADLVFDMLRFTAPGKVFDAEDLPAFRAELTRRSPVLGIIFALGAVRDRGPRLVTKSVEVPIAEYSKLSVEDFMVSLYNRHTVQRVVIVSPDAGDRLALDVLGEAVAWWRDFLG
jgi:hypothetical protein